LTPPPLAKGGFRLSPSRSNRGHPSQPSSSRRACRCRNDASVGELLPGISHQPLSFRYDICVDAQLVDLTDDQVAWASDTFKLLADPSRLRIVWTLLHGEHSVNSLAEHVGAQPSSVSQHLAKLHLARIVKRRREGTFFHYSIQNEHIGRLAQEALFNADHVVAGLQENHKHKRPGHSSEKSA
jgi:ArsR family transcriptional regulator, zinc-responsive transcriptional repressor